MCSSYGVVVRELKHCLAGSVQQTIQFPVYCKHTKVRICFIIFANLNFSLVDSPSGAVVYKKLSTELKRHMVRVLYLKLYLTIPFLYDRALVFISSVNVLPVLNKPSALICTTLQGHIVLRVGLRDSYELCVRCITVYLCSRSFFVLSITGDILMVHIEHQHIVGSVMLIR